jgi:hypothetical protein
MLSPSYRHKNQILAPWKTIQLWLTQNISLTSK